MTIASDNSPSPNHSPVSSFLKAVAVVTLLGLGVFFGIKPLLEWLLQPPQSEAPLHTSVGQDNFPIVKVPRNGSRAATLSEDQSLGSAAEENGLAFENPTVAGRDASAAAGNGETAPGRLRLVQPQQSPGSENASSSVPSSFSEPSSSNTAAASSQPAPSASTSQSAARPLADLRQAVRQLAQSLPRQNQAPQSVAQAPRLPEEGSWMASEPRTPRDNSLSLETHETVTQSPVQSPVEVRPPVSPPQISRRPSPIPAPSTVPVEPDPFPTVPSPANSPPTNSPPAAVEDPVDREPAVGNSPQSRPPISVTVAPQPQPFPPSPSGRVEIPVQPSPAAPLDTPFLESYFESSPRVEESPLPFSTLEQIEQPPIEQLTDGAIPSAWRLAQPESSFMPRFAPSTASVWQLDSGLSVSSLSAVPTTTPLGIVSSSFESPVWELAQPLTTEAEAGAASEGTETEATSTDETVAIAPTPSRPELPDELFVRRFNVVGSTAFSPEELAEDAQAALGDRPSDRPADSRDRPFNVQQVVSLAELLQASDRITQRYVDGGYLSSGAIIPEDGIQPDGTVTIQVIEGRLEEVNVARLSNQRQTSLIDHPFAQMPQIPSMASLSQWIFPEVMRDRLLITGNRDLSLGYVRRRLALAGSAPLNIDRLLAGVQLLQTNPLIETVSTEIREGAETGTSILDVDVIEAPTSEFQVAVNNSRSPSVGSIQQRASLSQANFLGFGDRLAVGANRTEGSDGWDVNYVIPLNARNGTLAFSYSNSSSEVIEEPFGILDIQSQSRSYEFTLRQPVYQTPTEEFALSLTASRRESQSEFLEGLFGTAEPFPSTGADENGETRISALRFAQDWTRQTSRQVFAVRSEFSLGLDLLGSTINPIRPDSRFFSWRGQGQWVRQIGSSALFLLRGDVQLADGPLVPGEQFGLGGQGTIRGYRQDTLLTDNGWLASAEFRIPILRIPSIDGVLQVTPFIELGQGWNPEDIDPISNVLASTGLGLVWSMGDRLSARLDYGLPLVNNTSGSNSLQEDGFHFSIQLSPF